MSNLSVLRDDVYSMRLSKQDSLASTAVLTYIYLIFSLATAFHVTRLDCSVV